MCHPKDSADVGDNAKERAGITARWGEALSANRTYRRGTEEKGKGVIKQYAITVFKKKKKNL